MLASRGAFFIPLKAGHGQIIYVPIFLDFNYFLTMFFNPESVSVASNGIDLSNDSLLI